VRTYAVVTDGVAIGFGIVALLKPVEGDHEKLVAFDTKPFKVVEADGAMETSAPAFTFGLEFTITRT
jgi:hypothetical protein